MRFKSFLIGTIVGGLAVRYFSNTMKAQKFQANPRPVTAYLQKSKGAAFVVLTQPMLPVHEPANSSDNTSDHLKSSQLKRILASICSAWQSSKFFLSSKHHYAPLSARWLTIVFCSLMVIGPLFGQTAYPADHIVPRFGAGLFLTIYSLAAWLLFKILLRSLYTRTWPPIIDRQNKFTMLFSIFLLILLFCTGFLTWYVGWVGSNAGWPFGCGAFLCGIIFETGPSRLIEYHSREIKLNDEELGELFHLVQEVEAYFSKFEISPHTEMAFKPSQNEFAEHKRRIERIVQLQQKWKLQDTSATKKYMAPE